MKTKHLFLLLFVLGCSAEKEGFQGQAPIELVSTKTLPVQLQWKGTWVSEDSLVFFSNDFEGARLNGFADDGNNHFSVLITAENTPINPSPWYAFKVWAKEETEVVIKVNFEGSRARYFPKLSYDGVRFAPVDSSAYTPVGLEEGSFSIESVPESFELKVRVGPNPVWVSAQEVVTSSTVFAWMDSIQMNLPSASLDTIGYSRQQRVMRMMQVEGGDSKKALMIISRQHPPEVTGYLAMKSFVETLANDSELSRSFREKFTCFIVPLMNPDGVDNGHWRHGVGGIDLNRDWHSFHQPETSSVRDLLNKKKEEGYEFVFGADFHSTWDDIYYPLDSMVTEGEEHMIIYKWINNITSRLPAKKTNVRPSNSPLEPTMVSRNYFYLHHDMPAIVFELGDNTPRPFLKEKGQVAAEEIMKLLIAEHYPE